ncbi:glycerophosphodiester phosphodiesterase [Lactococcus termiticola]|uniref:Glycerophosphoryl diester phosphodiesterase n=1 Tax=Lactococcus termiticola TaxID=2169526 RepID=A0A2R5HH80_9LACT|nr:glycerophosphodiester phosphodiesterase [Lactococcus termiticola]GBG96705.1 glycerophosphoryl diester phosphodiesterase [Lactococcus termiticola]
MSQTKILAHRGSSAYRPENMLEAFQLAIAQGADGIEIDVQFSKNGEIVVAHDEKIDRVSNGQGYIKDYSLTELKAFDFNQKFPEQDRAEIPTLRELYSLIKDSKLTVNCEFKTTEVLYPGLVKATIKLAEEFELTDRILYSSFNHYSLKEAKAISPKSEIGLLYELAMVDPWLYAQHVGAEYIHPPYQVIQHLPETVKACHEAGIGVNVWTANDSEVMKAMFEAGVDSIITDKPDLALKIRQEFEEKKA